MFNTEIRKINVTAVFAAYKSSRFVRRITPLSFDLPSGESYQIAEIRRSYTDRVGQSVNVHFVVRTKDERFFDIVYDSKEMTWRLVVEIEDVLMLP